MNTPTDHVADAPPLELGAIDHAIADNTNWDLRADGQTAETPAKRTQPQHDQPPAAIADSSPLMLDRELHNWHATISNQSDSGSGNISNSASGSDLSKSNSNVYDTGSFLSAPIQQQPALQHHHHQADGTGMAPQIPDNRQQSAHMYTELETVSAVSQSQQSSTGNHQQQSDSIMQSGVHQPKQQQQQPQQPHQSHDQQQQLSNDQHQHHQQQHNAHLNPPNAHNYLQTYSNPYLDSRRSHDTGTTATTTTPAAAVQSDEPLDTQSPCSIQSAQALSLLNAFDDSNSTSSLSKTKLTQDLKNGSTDNGPTSNVHPVAEAPRDIYHRMHHPHEQHMQPQQHHQQQQQHQHQPAQQTFDEMLGNLAFNGNHHHHLKSHANSHDNQSAAAAPTVSDQPRKADVSADLSKTPAIAASGADAPQYHHQQAVVAATAATAPLNSHEAPSAVADMVQPAQQRNDRYAVGMDPMALAYQNVAAKHHHRHLDQLDQLAKAPPIFPMNQHYMQPQRQHQHPSPIGEATASANMLAKPNTGYAHMMSAYGAPVDPSQQHHQQQHHQTMPAHQQQLQHHQHQQQQQQSAPFDLNATPSLERYVSTILQLQQVWVMC